MGTSMNRISIIGAGIGGLTAALALHDVGAHVTVYEQAKHLTDEGAGIQIAPNASRILCHLGLRHVLAADAVAASTSAYRHYRTGAVLKINDPSESVRRTGFPYWRIHRADLQRALVSALARRAPDALHLGWQVLAVETGSDNVSLVFSNGQRVTSDLVVAADGIRSTVRSMLFARDTPHFEGYVAWRGLVPMADLPERLRTMGGASFGGGRFIVNYAVRRGELMNFVAIARHETWEEEGWRIPSRLAELQEAFTDFHDDVQELIGHTPPDRLFKWGIFGRPRLPSWVQGRASLLGDAAHPMLPYLAQGGAMAIEDAMLLARAVANGDGHVSALQRWETARMPRVNRVSDASAAMAAMFHTDVDAYDPSRDVSAGRLPDLATFDALTAPI